jgi:hypothetical protein
MRDKMLSYTGRPLESSLIHQIAVSANRGTCVSIGLGAKAKVPCLLSRQTEGGGLIGQKAEGRIYGDEFSQFLSLWSRM